MKEAVWVITHDTNDHGWSKSELVEEVAYKNKEDAEAQLDRLRPRLNQSLSVAKLEVR